MTSKIHTYPLGDIIEHDRSGEDCICGPEVVPVECKDGSINWHIIHHALDGREHAEPDHDKSDCPLCSGGSDGPRRTD